MSGKRELKLGLSLSSQGSYRAGWRHKDAWESGLDLDAWRSVVSTAERGKIHFIFLADGAAVRVQARDVDALSYTSKIDMFEPLTLIAALSSQSENVGFVATASTSFNQPYTVARMFASLDYLSKGRVGWNVVTSWSENEARNFNLDKHIDHAERYRRAEEFVDIVKGLWDGWDDDAFIRDKISGRYFKPEGVRSLNHRGEFFSVQGPLNISRPIQGHPVVAQAGSSGPGMKLGARTADIVYIAQNKIEGAQQYYAQFKALLPEFGRSPESALVFPGIMPIVGKTRQEANDKLERLHESLHPAVGFGMLMEFFGDLSAYPLDGPLPEVEETTNGVKSLREMWVKRARTENLTIRQLYQEMAMSAGHLTVTGTPADIADIMEEWLDSNACDGFAVHAPFMPVGVTDFVDLVVPELQRRGRFRREYEGATLRENLGLSRPAVSNSAAVLREASH